MKCAPSTIFSPASVLLEEEEDIRVLKKTNKDLAQTNLKTSQSRITELEARLGLQGISAYEAVQALAIGQPLLLRSLSA